MRTSSFHYHLPETSIAQEPIEPRDAARLLVTDGLADHRFADLPALLDPADVVVVNRTRVRRARLLGRKEPTGGRVEALLLRPVGGDRWEALVRPARRIRIGTRLNFGAIEAVVAEGPVSGKVLLDLDAGPGDVEAAIAAAGTVPLPPYFHGELADPERYQTVYAEEATSAAAPTAGLHFTPAVLAALERRGIPLAAVDLDIGIDTFRPIAAEEIGGHEMHSERFRVGPETVEAVTAARARGGRVVAIGTTVVRALESAAAGGELRPMEGDTDLFVTPGYRFRVIDALVTNFHVPGSTLVVLVAALMGPEWRDAYAAALERGYRFLSFGDAMFAERAR